jgi:chromosome segregation ATPase
MATDDFYKSRGIDPRALQTLNARKNSRGNRQDDLRRKQAEREINALRARLTVIDREIQRLSVSGRRFHGDESRAETEFEQETKKFSELTKELARHSEKIKELNAALSSKKVSTAKLASKRDFGSLNAEKEVSRLKEEVRKVDHEIEQLDSKKRRLYSEVSSAIQKMEQAKEMEARTMSEFNKEEGNVAEIVLELKSEESMYNRFKARFSAEHRSMTAKQRELESVKKRMKGAETGSPALLNEKQKLEQKIQALEKELN